MTRHQRAVLAFALVLAGLWVFWQFRDTPFQLADVLFAFAALKVAGIGKR